MLLVQKYGGTSVGSLERLKNVALRVKAARAEGHEVVVVLSAQVGETDRLLKEARELAPDPDPRECDLLLATGEQRSIALLALHLKALGIPAVSLMGYQVPVMTDGVHNKARIQGIGVERMTRELRKGNVVVVAGFQGTTEDLEITTLGRGGSDTSAVALAAALKADLCEIYTDVDGVYTADPRHVPEAKLLKKITHEEMMELADSGAKVLQTRSVELAAKHRVPLMVRNSFNETSGTSVVPEEESLEKILVAGITLNTNEAKVAVRRIPSMSGILTQIFAPLAEAGVNVDMIVENLGADGTTDLAFTVAKEDLKKTMQRVEAVARKLGAGKVEAAGDIAKISVVGMGMRTHAGVAHQIFQVLADLGITVQMVSTSEIKVSLVIDAEEAHKAIPMLHQALLPSPFQPEADLPPAERGEGKGGGDTV